MDEGWKNRGTCSLYIAESTVPGAGLGLFSGQSHSPGDLVADGDIHLPIVDLSYHVGSLGFTDFFDPTEDYVWNGADVGMQFESSDPNLYLSSLGSGLDCAINCHFGLNNVDRKQMLSHSAHGLHRSKDPGVGAFTPYHNSTLVAQMPIPAGAELFKSYGSTYFVSREEYFGLVPFPTDYLSAERLLTMFHSSIMVNMAVAEEVALDLYTLIKHLPLKSRTLNALPDFSDVATSLKTGIKSVCQKTAIRTIDELEQKGRCMDKVRHGPSTLPQAGHGAFASKFIAKGEVVAGSPLLFIPAVDFFNMYDGDWILKQGYANTSKLVNRQIVYNYCLHHPDTSLYFFPYNAGVNFINHNKTLANVELRWAKDGELGHSEELLKQHPSNMMYRAAPGLFLDYVATRDIQSGEEIFLDYGDEWEVAWNTHAETWEERHRHSTAYVSAHDWNNEHAEDQIRTVDEQRSHPYPSNLQMRCLASYYYDHEFTSSEDRGWTSWDRGYECVVVSRSVSEDGTDLYLVRYLEHDANDQEEEEVVRGQIAMVDRPYTTDLYLEGVFRHPIGLPDSLLPDAWRGARLAYPKL